MNEEQIKQALLSVINGEVKEVNVPMLSIMKYSQILESLGLSFYDKEINGWQIDFWVYFIKEKQKFYLEGSLWYSSEYTFRLSEDEL